MARYSGLLLRVVRKLDEDVQRKGWMSADVMLTACNFLAVILYATLVL